MQARDFQIGSLSDSKLEKEIANLIHPDISDEDCIYLDRLLMEKQARRMFAMKQHPSGN